MHGALPRVLILLAAIALGGIMSMSSTAIVSKLLAERLEIQTPLGRQIFGALLFHDLAVVPLLIPAFAKEFKCCRARPATLRSRQGRMQTT